ncbi:MAG: uroporphyrinogen-III synthase [Rhodocyclaceae bacterium]|nr:uroporphyrinogen-III synthase [Rhodocyclaceae bacterium]
MTGAARVVVTRPAGQSAGLVAALREAGLQPVELPLLELVALPPPMGARRMGTATDLVVAVSPSAVTFGRDWWSGEWPPACAVAGVGAGTGRAWRAEGAQTVIEPAGVGDSEALLAHPALQQVAGRRVFILRGEGGRDLLGPTLRARGAEVDECLCYRRQMPAGLALRVAGVLRDPPAAWTVTSTEALAHLDAAWPAATPRTAPLFAPHPRIAAAARRSGWLTLPSGSGDAGLMTALQAWFDGADYDGFTHD